MAINLGLARITQLLAAIGNPQHAFKAIHVAGTNGKGSVCAYLSSVLTAAHLRPGRFTSPHFITERDAITISGEQVSYDEYNEARKVVEGVNMAYSIEASPFEVQTATAFYLFKVLDVQLALIEVGLGGREDATNVLGTVLCTAITKIAVDHEGFLGSTLGEIAGHKAGIMKSGVPCVVDASNAPEVLARIHQEAAELSEPRPPVILAHAGDVPNDLPLLAGGEFQTQNASVALGVLAAVFPQISSETIADGFAATLWPGRMQLLHPNLLVDGAHNPNAAQELRNFLDTKYGADQPVHWHVAFSKPSDTILRLLVRSHDVVSAHEFAPVEAMPWVKPQPATRISEVASRLCHVTPLSEPLPMRDQNPPSPTVICGSLYLVSQYLAR